MSHAMMHSYREHFRRNSAFPWIPAFIFLALFLSSPLYAEQVQKKVTTVLLVRHAEKDSIPTGNPSLTTQGRERAEALSHLLGNAGITSIVTTEVRRTRETATPLAQLLNITPAVIPVIWTRSTPRKVSPEYYTSLAKYIHANEGGTILVVGHSNTIPELIRVLGGPSDIIINESEFDHVYTLVLQGGAPLKVMDLRYGKE